MHDVLFGLPRAASPALLLFLIGSAWAQDRSKAPPTLEERVAKVETERQVTRRLAGHNAWMLTSSALVLFMTAPGLAMFYSGLVRKKNVLGVMMQCLFLDGADDGDLGPLWLLAGVWRRSDAWTSRRQY